MKIVNFYNGNWFFNNHHHYVCNNHHWSLCVICKIQDNNKSRNENKSAPCHHHDSYGFVVTRSWLVIAIPSITTITRAAS